jgi:ATP-dependent Zn protease
MMAAHAKIRIALRGRVAEEVVYGKITTGTESDIEQSLHRLTQPE